MKRPKAQTHSGSDRLMDHVEKLVPLPDGIQESRAAAGKILRQVRERLGFSQQSIGPLYAAAYRRIYPHRRTKSTLSASTLRNWEDGFGEPQHGRACLLALLAVYIEASRQAGSISPDVVDDVLFLYDYRRMNVEEMETLFPPSGRNSGGSGPSEVGTLRRLMAAASADKWYDEFSVESRIMRTAARTLADADGTVIRGETIDKIESEVRRVVASGGGTSMITKFLNGLVRVSKEPDSAAVVTMLQHIYIGRSAGDR